MHDQEASNLLKRLSPQEFLGVGMDQIAYIRPVGGSGFSIHAADGTQLTIVSSYNDAVLAARTNDLYPVTLH